MKTDYEIEKEAFFEQRDRDIAKGKEMITFSLRGNNKDYYALQCLQFSENIKRYGFNHIATKERLADEYLYFQKHRITLEHHFGYDLKTFDSKEEMLGFVIGYNEAINNLEHDNLIKGA